MEGDQGKHQGDEIKPDAASEEAQGLSGAPAPEETRGKKRSRRRTRARAKKKQPWYKRAKPEWVLAVLTAVLAITGIWQAMESQRAATAAVDAVRSADREFRASQRPFVLVTVDRIEPLNLASALPQFIAKIVWTNHGHYPAIHVSPKYAVLPIPELDADWFFTRLNDGTIAPGHADSILGPEPASANYEPLSNPITPAETMAILQTDKSIVVVGRITYQDLYGKHYHTDFCFTRLITRAVEYCYHHNELGDDDSGVK
jgi:hypothetical protein